MIIKLNKDHCVGVPCNGSQKIIDLSPSYQEVSDTLWALARVNAIGLITSGDIVEERVKVTKEESEAFPPELILESETKTETTKRLVPAKLKDIDRREEKVFKVVRGTFHTPTLKQWYAEELRADVRIELQKQMDGIESGAIKG